MIIKRTKKPKKPVAKYRFIRKKTTSQKKELKKLKKKELEWWERGLDKHYAKWGAL